MKKALRRLKQYPAIDIAMFLIGSFICYIPISMLTKMAGKGLFAAQNGVPAGVFEILPLYGAGDVFASIAFFYLSGWWGLICRKNIFGFSVPWPRWYVFFSALCVILQIFTVLWAYAYQGISIVFAALLMKGGVLIIAPAVDIVAKKRKIYWPSWVGAILSLIALFVASLEDGSTGIQFAVAVDIFIYLLSYFVRLSIMSRFAKNDEPDERKRYIMEEQLVIVILFPLVLAAMGIAGYFLLGENALCEVYRGFVELPTKGMVMQLFAIGIAAVGAGVFGTLVFLDKRENTFCVSSVHSMSVIAGTVATILLAVFYGQDYPGINKFIGVVIIIGAIAFLAYRGSIDKNAERLADTATEDGAEI